MRDQQSMIAGLLHYPAPAVEHPLTKGRERLRIRRIVSAGVSPELRQILQRDLVRAQPFPSAEIALAQRLPMLDGDPELRSKLISKPCTTRSW